MVKCALAIVLATVSAVFAPAAETIPQGTTLHCRLTETLSTRVSLQGDRFTATVTEPLALNGHDVVPAGATITGRIASLESPGRVRGVGEMRLSAETLTLPGGRSFPLNAVLEAEYGSEGVKVVGEEGTLKGPSSRRKTAEETAGLAAGGGLLGLAFGHPVVGMLSGGAAGFVDRMRRRGQDLTLVKGTQLDFQLTRDLVIQ